MISSLIEAIFPMLPDLYRPSNVEHNLIDRIKNTLPHFLATWHVAMALKFWRVEVLI